jgi:hypothetical protein
VSSWSFHFQVVHFVHPHTTTTSTMVAHPHAVLIHPSLNTGCCCCHLILPSHLISSSSTHPSTQDAAAATLSSPLTSSRPPRPSLNTMTTTCPHPPCPPHASTRNGGGTLPSPRPSTCDDDDGTSHWPHPPCPSTCNDTMVYVNGEHRRLVHLTLTLVQ